MQDLVNILLVDDEQRNLDALEAILAEPGYLLLRAQDADTALKHLLEHDVAAIVLDIKMPGMSGFELAKLIKGTRRYRQIPIVFLTAHLLDDEDIAMGYGAGAVDCLTKPVNPKILRHKLGVFADLFRKTRALAELNEKLEQRVLERTAELERANQQKDAFLATLAHELRNPLAPLRTGLDLLLRTEAPTPTASRVLPAMNRQLEHMVRLIDDLLDVSRVTRGTLELRKATVDLASVVEQALETARPFLEQRKVRTVVELRDSCIAEIDATRVSQIIGNLLHNAAKYSPVSGEVKVTLERKQDSGVIRVQDSGVGIPLEQLERVFEMFARIPSAQSRSDGGLGIGLALARKLAELHGGTLEAESAGEGQGATFVLTLPGLNEARIEQERAKQSQPPAAIAALDIVVIEDNDDVAQTLVLWLERMGHRVQLATTGTDGCRLVLETRPNIVLCDVGLPGMDGAEVCRRIRAESDSAPVMVALTGWGTEADRQRTTQAGFDHHIVKPVAPDTLLKILGNVRPVAQV